MVNHTQPPKAPCAHKTYRLSCNDYDRLVEAAGGTCQLCGIKPADTPQGFLVVDHDARLGWWAVRGLLCTDCNTALPSGAEPAWAQKYLADPWWRREVSEADTVLPEEPAVGRVVVAPNNIHWRRTAVGWEHTVNYGGPPRTWAWLGRRYGAHNLKPLM